MPQQCLKTREFLESFCSSVQVGRLKELEGDGNEGWLQQQQTQTHSLISKTWGHMGKQHWFSIALIFFIYGVPTQRCCLLGGLGGPLSISPGPSRLFSQCPPFLPSVTGTQQTQMSPYELQLSYENDNILVSVGISIIFINHSLERDCQCH